MRTNASDTARRGEATQNGSPVSGRHACGPRRSVRLSGCPLARCRKWRPAVSVAQPRPVRALLAKATQLKIALKAPVERSQLPAPSSELNFALAASSNTLGACSARVGGRLAYTRGVWNFINILLLFFADSCIAVGDDSAVFLEYIKSVGCRL